MLLPHFLQDIVLWQVQSSCTDVRRSSTLLRPVQTLMGHVDWIFGLSWISNDQLVSAGRDKTIKLWQVPHAAAAGSHGEYCYQSDDHGAAVMSVKFHKVSGKRHGITPDIGSVRPFEPPPSELLSASKHSTGGRSAAIASPKLVSKHCVTRDACSATCLFLTRLCGCLSPLLPAGQGP